MTGSKPQPHHRYTQCPTKQPEAARVGRRANHAPTRDPDEKPTHTFMTCRMRGALSLLCSKLGRLLPSAGCSTNAALSSLTYGSSPRTTASHTQGGKSSPSRSRPVKAAAEVRHVAPDALVDTTVFVYVCVRLDVWDKVERGT